MHPTNRAHGIGARVRTRVGERWCRVVPHDGGPEGERIAAGPAADHQGPSVPSPGNEGEGSGGAANGYEAAGFMALTGNAARDPRCT